MHIYFYDVIYVYVFLYLISFINIIFMPYVRHMVFPSCFSGNPAHSNWFPANLSCVSFGALFPDCHATFSVSHWPRNWRQSLYNIYFWRNCALACHWLMPWQDLVYKGLQVVNKSV